MLRSRRFALAATAIVFGLSSCGDAGSTTSTSGNPAVIHIGANSGGKVAAGDAERAAMPYFANITYVFDGAYPDLGTSGPSWSLPTGVTPDLAKVKALAALLGVEGDVTTLPTDQGGGWMVGPRDYSAATLTVSADGMLSWWYNPDPGTVGVGWGCAEPGGKVVDPSETTGGGTDSSSGSTGATSGSGGQAVTPDTAVAPPVDTVVVPPDQPCTPPPPPANVPTKDQAIAKAKELLTSLGVDPASFDFQAYGDEYSASVMASLVLDGHTTAIQYNIGYGENGAVTWASGSFAQPVKGADYPIVSVEAALARLNDDSGRWMWFGGAPGVMTADVANGAAKTSGTGTSPDVGAPVPAAVSEAVAGGAAVDAMPIAPCDSTTPDCTVPVPEEITVHFNAVKLDTTMIWAADGTIWLLPAYTFSSADGGQYTVVAVDEAFLDIPSPTTPDTVAPGDPGTAPGGTVVSPPIDTVAPGDTTVPVMPDPVSIDVATKLLVGLSVDEATKVADGNGWTVRISTLDGEAQMLTADYSPLRINLNVQGGVVLAIDSVG